MQTAPARPGDSRDAIDTPALVVDLDALERNLDLMANAARGAGIALRPHVNPSTKTSEALSASRIVARCS